jgi:hypothetical protein
MPSKISEDLALIASEATLYTTAVEILRTTQLDITEARPKFVAVLEKDRPLLAALGGYYLQRVAADMRHAQHMTAEAKPAKAVEAPDQASAETHYDCVGGHPSSTAASAEQAEAAKAPDHKPSEAQSAVVGGRPISMAVEAKPAEAAKAPDQSLRETQFITVGGRPSMVAETRPVEAAKAPDQPSAEAQSNSVGGRPSSMAVEAEQVEAVTVAPDHLIGETQSRHVGSDRPSPTKPTKSTKPAKPAKPEIMSRGHAGPHRRHRKMPSELELAAEKALVHQTTLFDTWTMRDGRRIGDLSWHELPSLAVEEVKIGFNFVVRGEQDLIDGIACHLLTQHAQVSDQMSKVRDNVSEAVLKRIEKQARKVAKTAIDRVRQMPREVLAELTRESAAIEQR